MEADRTLNSIGSGLDSPRAVLDAGGETWITLRDLIWRRITDLATGEVLQIISLEPSTRADVAEWCRHAGQDLLHMATEGDETRFWIRKNGQDKSDNEHSSRK